MEMLWILFKILLIIIGIIILIGILIFLYFIFTKPWVFNSKKFHDPQRLLIFGRPGKGKTTLAVLEIIQRLRKGEIVVSNISVIWFGYVFLVSPIHKAFNKYVKIIFNSKILKNKFYKKIEKYKKEIKELEHWKNIKKSSEIDKTKLYQKDFLLKEEKERIEKFYRKVNNGWFHYAHYPKENYIFEDDLEKAIEKVIDKSQEDDTRKFSIVFDEGFSYLDASRKVPPFVTSFFNQTRKLNCSVLVASQRPTAVYPSFRALVDFMILVDKGWFGRFSSKKYYVDSSADALPDLNQIHKGRGLFGNSETIDTGENYKSYKGSDVFPFFNTRQSFALKELLEEHKNS